MRAAPSLLNDIKERVSPTDYLDYRGFLAQVFKVLKGTQKRYSYVQFAEDLGFSKTNVMYLIIKGQRPLSVKASSKISQALNLTGTQKNYFETLVKYQNAKALADREKLFQSLLDIKTKTLDSAKIRAQLEFFSEWYHTAIYEMTMFADFQSDPNWIAEHITPRIRPEQARKSLHLLTALGLIEYRKDLGKHLATQARVTTGDEIASVAVTRYHQKMIEMGRESITRIKDKERDISSITIAIPSSALQKYKQEISMFRKKLLAMADAEQDKNAVFQMNVQLFPLTNLDQDPRND